MNKERLLMFLVLVSIVVFIGIVCAAVVYFLSMVFGVKLISLPYFLLAFFISFLILVPLSVVLETYLKVNKNYTHFFIVWSEIIQFLLFVVVLHIINDHFHLSVHKSFFMEVLFYFTLYVLLWGGALFGKHVDNKDKIIS
ncbi:hypothetical protein NSQ26_09900 [Bacillus sp. FSL W7-1360]